MSALSSHEETLFEFVLQSWKGDRGFLSKLFCLSWKSAILLPSVGAWWRYEKVYCLFPVIFFFAAFLTSYLHFPLIKQFFYCKTPRKCLATSKSDKEPFEQFRYAVKIALSPYRMAQVSRMGLFYGSEDELALIISLLWSCLVCGCFFSLMTCGEVRNIIHNIRV